VHLVSIRFLFVLLLIVFVTECATQSQGGSAGPTVPLPRGARSCEPVFTGLSADTSLDSTNARIAFRPANHEVPHYPDALRNEAPRGHVATSFVIDTTGKPVPGSVVILQESRREFGDAVCAWARRVRYAPIRFDGRLVSVRVSHLEISLELTP
jgi:hypothetical protein